MSKKRTEEVKNPKKTIYIVLGIIVPLLVVFAVLIGTHTIDVKIPLKKERLDPMVFLTTSKLHCYNVNWFGTEGTGFQVVFKETMSDILSKINSTGIKVDESFFKDPIVIDYLVRTCPHIDNRDQIPYDYDPDIGVSALDKCIQRKHDTSLCTEFIK